MTQQATPAQRAFPSRFRPCVAGAVATAALSLLCGPAGAQALAGAAAAILVAPGLGLPELARTAPAAPAAPAAVDAGTGKGADGVDAGTFQPDGPRAAGRGAPSATAAPAAAATPAAAPRHAGREAA